MCSFLIEYNMQIFFSKRDTFEFFRDNGKLGSKRGTAVPHKADDIRTYYTYVIIGKAGH